MNLNLMSLMLETQTAGGGELITMLIPMVLLVLVFYFIIYRPQKKQEKETQDMRSSIELGDVIVTNGGIVGMVVKIKDDMLLIESGGNRTKLQIQKWAVHSIIEKANEPEEKKEENKKYAFKGENLSGFSQTFYTHLFCKKLLFCKKSRQKNFSDKNAFAFLGYIKL